MKKMQAQMKDEGMESPMDLLTGGGSGKKKAVKGE